MLSAPYTNNMLQALSADPEMASQIVNQVGKRFYIWLQSNHVGFCIVVNYKYFRYPTDIWYVNDIKIIIIYFFENFINSMTLK